MVTSGMTGKKLQCGFLVQSGMPERCGFFRTRIPRTRNSLHNMAIAFLFHPKYLSPPGDKFQESAHCGARNVLWKPNVLDFISAVR